MLRFALCLFLLGQVANSAHIMKRSRIDMGTYWLVCSQEPLEIGIVLDSSASINVGSIYNFKKGLTFLQDVLDHFEIGDGRNDTRVSIIPFAWGAYPRESFQLDTYHTKPEVLQAIGQIPYLSGGRTDTDEGIDYMVNHLLNPSHVRSYAEKMGIVLTDGDSRNKGRTAASAKRARAAGIEMFAVGVGSVKMEELINIAGSKSRVIHVTSFDKLTSQVDNLTKKTCRRVEKPTTTPPPPTACGEDHPGDVNFVFSPADIGFDATIWTTDFISQSVHNEDFEVGFKFGVVSGSCPEDEGFFLNRYDNAEDISHRLLEYEHPRMEGLLERVSSEAFTSAHGGRADAQNIAVLAVTEDNFEGLQDQINQLVADGVRVFVVDPNNSGEVRFEGAEFIHGSEPFEAAQHFVSLICG